MKGEQLDKKYALLEKKHNLLTAEVAAIKVAVQQIGAFTASEMGKTAGETESRFRIIARSFEGTEVNIFAIGEMLKEVFGQLTQLETIIKNVHAGTVNIFSNQYPAFTEDGSAHRLVNQDFEDFKAALELTEAQIMEVKDTATEWYKRILIASIETSQQNLKDQLDAQMKADALEKAKKEAMAQAVEAHVEKQNVEAELADAANSERNFSPNTGGQGSEFPDGADIFGG